MMWHGGGSSAKDDHFCDPVCAGPVFLSISARYQAQLRKVVEMTEIPVEDSLRFSEFISWLVGDHLDRAVRKAEEVGIGPDQEREMSRAVSELYVLCCRCFMVQLLHAAYNRFRASVGDWQCAAVIGVVSMCLAACACGSTRARERAHSMRAMRARSLGRGRERRGGDRG